MATAETISTQRSPTSGHGMSGISVVVARAGTKHFAVARLDRIAEPGRQVRITHPSIVSAEIQNESGVAGQINRSRTVPGHVGNTRLA
jgi:hypothetical protein